MRHTINRSVWSSVERLVLSLQQCRYHLLYPSYDNVKHYIRKNYRMADRGLFHACIVTHIMCHDQRNRVGLLLRRLFSLFVGMAPGVELRFLKARSKGFCHDHGRGRAEDLL